MPRRLRWHIANRRGAALMTALIVGALTVQLAATAPAGASPATPRTGDANSTDAGAGDLSGAGGSFSGVASADAYRLRVAVTNFLIIEDFVDGGGPSSQSALDSLGESTGFASFPYPGATGASLLGVISTLTGKSLPSYPFIVNSQYPSNPEQDVTQPGYRLHAASRETSSESATNAGNEDTSGNQIGGFSKTHVMSSAGTLVSHAEAYTHLKLNALTISGATAIAELKRDAQGKLTRTSSLIITGLTLAGIPIGVTDKGLVVGTTAVPLNALGAVTDTISRNGVTLTFLPASQTADSQMSAGLRITSSQPVPNTSGTQITTITIGQAFVRADSSTFGSSFPITLPPAPPVLSGGGTTPPLDAGSGVALSPSTPVTGGEPSAADHPSGPAPTVPSNNSATRFVSAANALPELSFYPILALAGLVVLATSLGVRRSTRVSA